MENRFFASANNNAVLRQSSGRELCRADEATNFPMHRMSKRVDKSPFETGGDASEIVPLASLRENLERALLWYWDLKPDYRPGDRIEL